MRPAVAIVMTILSLLVIAAVVREAFVSSKETVPPTTHSNAPRPQEVGEVVEDCKPSELEVHGLDVGPLYSHGNSRVKHCKDELDFAIANKSVTHNQYKRCVGTNPRGDGKTHAVWEKRLRREAEPMMFPMHGGVSAERMMKLAHQLASLCPLKLSDSSSWPNGTIVAELGCGNAALLSVVAPPLPHVVGVGSDIATALIDHGSEYYPHLSLHRSVGLPMVPTGSVTCVYSLGVMMYLNIDASCNHIGEALRLLEPGGKLIIHALPVNNARIGSWTTFLPSFFRNRTTEGRVVFFPSCTAIGGLAADVNIITKNDFAVYNYPSFHTVVIERNSKPFHCLSRTISSFAVSKDDFFTRVVADRVRKNVHLNMSWYANREQRLLTN